MSTKFHRIYKLERFGPQDWWQLRGFFFTVDSEQIWFSRDQTVDRAVEWLQIYRRQLKLKFKLFNDGWARREEIKLKDYPGPPVHRLRIEFNSQEQAYQFLNRCLLNAKWFAGAECPELDTLMPAICEQYVEPKQLPGETVEQLNDRITRARRAQIKRIEQQ